MEKDAFDITELNGIIKVIRNPFNKKIIDEVCIGKNKFRRNKVYGTYNSVMKNELLKYKDSRKIRTCK